MGTGRAPLIKIALSLYILIGVYAAPTVTVLAAEPEAAAAAADSKSLSQSTVISSMEKELKRSMDKLKNVAAAPLYFLSYAVYDCLLYTSPSPRD